MKVSYYPGCSLHGTGKEYDLSLKAVCGALGIELKEIDDWACCGASSAHALNFALSVYLPAKDLIAAEKEGLRKLLVPCAACFNRMKFAQYHLRKDPEMRKEVEDIVGAPYRDTITIFNAIDFFSHAVGVEKITAQIRKPLHGLKPVSYLGCLLLRPPKICTFDDYENPVLLDKLMEALGSEVIPWSYKTDCCGGSLTISKTKYVIKLVDKLMTMAGEAGANCVVTACPVCMANLDMRASERLRMPIFYFTELMALAMGVPGTERWFHMHNIDVMPLLLGLGLL